MFYVHSSRTFRQKGDVNVLFRQIVCSIRARASAYSTPGPSREANFFLGAIPRRTVFTVEENGDSVDFILDLTIPFVYMTFDGCELDQISNPTSSLGIFVHVPDRYSSGDTCHPVDALISLERDLDGNSACIIQASPTQIRATISANIGN